MAIAELKNGKQVPLQNDGETQRILYALTALQQTALKRVSVATAASTAT